MKRLAVAAGIAGFLLGCIPVSADTVVLRSFDILVVFLGSIISAIFIVGLQVLVRKPRSARSALRSVVVISIFLVAMGVSTLLIATLRGAITPDQVAGVAFGAGLLFGAGISKLAFGKALAI
jgi:hypothetical protein